MAMVYRRRFDPDGSDSLAKLARWVKPGSRVLELGSAAGYFTEHLRSRDCEVDIVEIDASAAREAAPHARRTIVADLDGDAWCEALGDARYDAIVCADVLEHLADGARLLVRLRERLADGGTLLLSVPNVAHSAVIASLLDERFDYGGEGLLDPTHLRLYTWRSLAGVLAESGYAIVEWDCTHVELYDTEFRVRIEALPAALRDALVGRPNASVYQWLVRAVPGTRADAPGPVATALAQTVPVRLLFAASADELSLERGSVARLPASGEREALEWRFPHGTHALRLLLSDRIGVVDVASVQLHAQGRVAWSSGDHAQPFEASPHAVAVDEARYALVQADAWIAPAVSPEVIARCDTMTATLAWPAGALESGAFAALVAMARALRGHIDAAVRDHDELSSQLYHTGLQRDELRQAHAQARRALDDARNERARRDAEVASLEQAVQGFRGENARLDAALAAQERIINYRQSLRWWLKLPLMRAKWWWHRTTGR